jgi:hypothetical protein
MPETMNSLRTLALIVRAGPSSAAKWSLSGAVWPKDGGAFFEFWSWPREEIETIRMSDIDRTLRVRGKGWRI